MTEQTTRDGQQGDRQQPQSSDLFRTAGGEADTGESRTDPTHRTAAAPPSWTPFQTAPDGATTEKQRPATPPQTGGAMRSLQFPFEAAADATDQQRCVPLDKDDDS